MMRGALGVLLPMLVVTAGLGVQGTADLSGPSLTVYPQNLGLVRMEVPRILDRGMHVVRVEGLPSNLERSSLLVLNPGVTLRGTHGYRSYQSAAAGSGASLALDLEVTEGIEVLELAFLTSGLSWSASYSMLVSGDDKRARMDGFGTVSNNSGTGWERAELQLLAGEVFRGGSAPRQEMLRMAAMDVSEEAVGSLSGAAFGGYHLYTLSTPLNLAAGESRRIRLMGAEGLETRKEYIFSHTLSPYQAQAEPVTEPVAMRYRVERKGEGEFATTPLPAGQVRMYQRDEAGRLQLLGMAGISNTPAQENLLLPTGFAFDIVGTRTQTDYSRSGNVYESGWKLELRNRTDARVTVQVIERLQGDWRILESTHEAQKLSAAAVRFDVEVPADGESVLEYRVSVKS